MGSTLGILRGPLLKVGISSEAYSPSLSPQIGPSNLMVLRLQPLLTQRLSEAQPSLLSSPTQRLG